MVPARVLDIKMHGTLDIKMHGTVAPPPPWCKRAKGGGGDWGVGKDESRRLAQAIFGDGIRR
jgi:hypothetical protein